MAAAFESWAGEAEAPEACRAAMIWVSDYKGRAPLGPDPTFHSFLVTLPCLRQVTIQSVRPC
jgi:hypothetical protein